MKSKPKPSRGRSPVLAKAVLAGQVKQGQKLPALRSADSAAAVRLLLAAGANPNQLSTLGNAPLHLYAANGLSSLVDALLSGGADVNLRDREGVTALIAAADHGKVKVVEVLLKHDAKVELQGRLGFTALHAIAGRTKFKSALPIARMLLDAGANLETRDSSGRTPLTVAARSRYPQFVTFLLRRGAKVNAAAPDGLTPLVCAVLEEDLQMVKLLLKAGAKADVRMSAKCRNRSLAGASLSEIAAMSAAPSIRKFFARRRA